MMKILLIASAFLLHICLVGCEQKSESTVFPATKTQAPVRQILKSPVEEKNVTTEIQKEAVKANAEVEKKVSAEVKDQPLAETIEHARKITQTRAK